MLNSQIALPFSDKKAVTIREKFDVWIATKHGQEVEAFVVERARRLQNKRHSHYGMKALFEAYRYHIAETLGPDAEGYKINNNYTSLMARRVMARHDWMDGFFETRETKEGG